MVKLLTIWCAPATNLNSTMVKIAMKLILLLRISNYTCGAWLPTNPLYLNLLFKEKTVCVAASLEEEGLDDESLDKFEADGYEIEYEGEEDFEAELRGDKSDG